MVLTTKYHFLQDDFHIASAEINLKGHCRSRNHLTFFTFPHPSHPINKQTICFCKLSICLLFSIEVFSCLDDYSCFLMAPSSFSLLPSFSVLSLSRSQNKLLSDHRSVLFKVFLFALKIGQPFTMVYVFPCDSNLITPLVLHIAFNLILFLCLQGQPLLLHLLFSLPRIFFPVLSWWMALLPSSQLRYSLINKPAISTLLKASSLPLFFSHYSWSCLPNNFLHNSNYSL